MTPEREAAERLRKIKAHHPEGIVYGNGGVNRDYEAVTNAICRDHATLANAYLALVRADDDTAIDEDWLKSVGFDWNSFEGMWKAKMTNQLISDGESLRTEIILWDDGACFLSQGPDQGIKWPAAIKTRGAVRALVRALVVKLKEDW